VFRKKEEKILTEEILIQNIVTNYGS